MVLKFKLFKLSLFFSLFINIYSSYSLIKAKNLTSYCEKNIYKIIIDIDIVDPPQEYINFYLTTISKQNLLFKCIIEPNKNQIICIANLYSQKVELYEGDSITLPYPFPEIEGVVWEYMSFLFGIFRKRIIVDEQCGESVIKSDIAKLNVSRWDLITKINKIYDGKCLISDKNDNFYSFNMNLNIIGGNLKDLLDEASKSKSDDFEINLMQNITMPFKVGHLTNLINDNIFEIHEFYKFAFCYPLETINSINYLNESGIDFLCNIPISEQYIFNGPLKISTFSDNIYTKITDENKIDFISIYFTTEKNPSFNENIEEEDEGEEEEEEEEEEEGENDNEEENPINEDEQKEDNSDKNSNNPSISSSSQAQPLSSSNQAPSVKSSSGQPSSSPFSSSSSSNLRRLQIIRTGKKKKEYLLLDNRKNNYICPDKPIFEITNIENGIIYKPIEENENKYNIILTGYLKNGYKISEKKIVPLEYTLNEINFNLSITNNLIEETTEKKKIISCYLGSGTMFLQKEAIEIKCIGDKINQNKNDNTDITLNWASKENKYLNEIIIKWPKDLTLHSKKLYSYNINALSIKKTDYDCYDDKYYFYINIIDLKSEPNISFELRMLLPLFSKAICKLYTSNLLKCYLDLRLRKIRKGARIRLPVPGNYNISTNEGNYINFTVLHFSDENETNYADEGIITDETCGNNMFVGAIQDIGYTYGSAIAIIISILAITFIVIFGIGYCFVYEITHRNRKGKYFAHTEEKKEDVNNTTNNPIEPKK